MGGAKAIIFVGPLPPGEYPFFGEFNPGTALGKIIVRYVDDDAWEASASMIAARHSQVSPDLLRGKVSLGSRGVCSARQFVTGSGGQAQRRIQILKLVQDSILSGRATLLRMP
jgi:hypothetical protein